MEKYLRASLEVSVEKYETGKGLEDGFQALTEIITSGWTVTENLVKVQQPDGMIVCPFISNRRGLVFINEGDYIIFEGDNERHVCSSEKFIRRFVPIGSEGLPG